MTKLGPKSGPFFSFDQAFQSWSWWNLYADSTPAGKRIVGLNMDETAIRFYMQSRGLVAPPTRGKRKARPTHACSRKQMRACMTHVAFVATDPDVQAMLPQIFIGSENVLRVTDVELLQPAFRENLILVRRKTAWINTEVLVEIMKCLGRALAPWRASIQPVLLMDAHKAHLAPAVLHAAAAAGLWVLPLPAHMTWLLQPLDTHVFAAYKQAIRRRYVLLMAQHAEGQVNSCSLLTAVHDACVDMVCERDHTRAFVDNGFGDEQGSLRPSLLRELETDAVGAAVPCLPSYNDLCEYLGAAGGVCIRALFAAFEPRREREPRPAPTSLSPSAMRPEDEPHLSWHERLRPRRSRSSLTLADSPAAPSSLPEPSPAPGPPLPPPPWPPQPAMAPMAAAPETWPPQRARWIRGSLERRAG